MRYCFVFIVFISSQLIARAQAPAPHATGLVFNDSDYELAPRMAIKGGSRAVITEPVVSLTHFTPYPGNQGSCNSCVGWATCYAALTSSWAVKYNQTNRDVITGQAFSPAWVYAQLAPACTEGVNIVRALEILKDEGDCRIYDFRQPVFFNDEISRFKSKAYLNRIKDYVTLFADTAGPNDKIRETKLSLANQKPVIIAANVDREFDALNAAQYIWHPVYTNSPPRGHAMCVVGYNDFDQTFEVMNSWGADWGNKGYFKIKYDDFARVVKYAFQITLDDRADPENDRIVVNGDFRIEQISSYDTITRKITSSPKQTFLKGGIYELGGVQQNDFFRLFAKNIRRDCYVYVFSIDPANRAEVLYPFSKNSDFAKQYNLGATVVEVPRAYSADEIEIPGQEHAFQTDVQGTDYMCILFSYNQISDIEQVASRVRDSHAGSFPDRLREALGNRLISGQDLNYKTNSMSVSGSSKSGDVVPIILKVNVN